MKQNIIIYTDGGARGNPGPAGIGCAIFSAENLAKPIATHKKYIGKITNNQAEYKAVVLGLEQAKKMGAYEVEVRLDSELVCNQITGKFKLKNSDFQESFIRIWNLRQGFKKCVFKYVPREKNKLADKLVNEAIDSKLALS